MISVATEFARDFFRLAFSFLSAFLSLNASSAATFDGPAVAADAVLASPFNFCAFLIFSTVGAETSGDGGVGAVAAAVDLASSLAALLLRLSWRYCCLSSFVAPGGRGIAATFAARIWSESKERSEFSIFVWRYSPSRAFLCLFGMSTSTALSPFSQAHRRYVQHLYRRALKGAQDWYVRRDLWRDRAIEIRVAFEKNKNVKDPRAVALLLNEAEKEVIRLSHPDPYRAPLFAEGTKWERNAPPRIFSDAEKAEALEAFRNPHH